MVSLFNRGAPPGVCMYLIWIELLSVDADEGHEDVAHGITVDSLPWRWLGLIKSWSDGARRCCWFAVGIVRVAITLPGQRQPASAVETWPVQWKETIRNWTQQQLHWKRPDVKLSSSESLQMMNWPSFGLQQRTGQCVNNFLFCELRNKAELVIHF